MTTWGDPDFGGDCSSVADQLREVADIYHTSFAFAALLKNGTLVTWGHKDCGGDSVDIQPRLNNIELVTGTERAFCAIKGDGNVIAWGDAQHGGDSFFVQHEFAHLWLCASMVCSSQKVFNAAKLCMNLLALHRFATLSVL